MRDSRRQSASTCTEQGQRLSSSLGRTFGSGHGWRGLAIGFCVVLTPELRLKRLYVTGLAVCGVEESRSGPLRATLCGTRMARGSSVGSETRLYAFVRNTGRAAPTLVLMFAGHAKSVHPGSILGEHAAHGDTGVYDGDHTGQRLGAHRRRELKRRGPLMDSQIPPGRAHCDRLLPE